MTLNSNFLVYLILPGVCFLVFLLYRPHRIRKAKLFNQLKSQYGAKVGLFYARFRFKGYPFTVSAPAMSPVESLVKIHVSSPWELIGSAAFYPKIAGELQLSMFFWGLRDSMTLESGDTEFRARTDNTKAIQRLQEDKEIWDKLPGLIFQSLAGMLKVDARRKQLTLEGLNLEWVMRSPEVYFLLCCQILEALDVTASGTDKLAIVHPV